MVKFSRRASLFGFAGLGLGGGGGLAGPELPRANTYFSPTSAHAGQEPDAWSAWTLCAALRRRRIGAEEALDLFLERVARHNGALNAIVVLDEERARARARALDGDRRLYARAPLRGLPVTIKENIDVEGLATTSGHLDRRMPRSRSHIGVERLVAAGAVPFGKTNSPVDGGDYDTSNPVYGRTYNPWSRTRVPGGSSGGSAAAVAAGLSPLDLADDLAGSIRVPSAYCGVFGHKPSWGIIPYAGYDESGLRGVDGDIAVKGPIASDSRDLDLMLQVIAGPDPLMSQAFQLALQPARVSGLAGARIAIWFQQDGQLLSRETARKLSEVERALSREGAVVGATARPAFDPALSYEVALRLTEAQISAGLAAAAGRPDPEDRSGTAQSLLALEDARHKIRQAFHQFFRDWDVLVTPTTPTCAFPIPTEPDPYARLLMIDEQEASYWATYFWMHFASVAWLPATNAPVGLGEESGMPIGVQVIGDYGADRTTIAVAGALTQAMGGVRRPRGFA